MHCFNRNIRPVIRNAVCRIELEFSTPKFCSVLDLLLGLLLKLSDYFCSVCRVVVAALPVSPGSES